MHALGAVPDPIEWIRGKIDAFMALPAKWGAAVNRLIPIASDPMADAGRRAAARASLDEIRDLAAKHKKVTDLLGFRRQSLGALGVLWVIPALSAVALASAAWAMHSIFRKSTASELRYQAIIEGAMTPGEAQAQTQADKDAAWAWKQSGLGGGVAGSLAAGADLVKYALLAALAYVALPLIRQAAGR